MSDNRLKIGITQGDTNGVGWESTLRTLADSRTTELFTPVVYGSLAAAKAYMPLLEKNNDEELSSKIQFNVVASAAEARYGKINLVECSDVKPTPGVASKEGGKAAVEALERAVADLKDGTNYALKIASSSSYFAVKDADKKLVGTDFTVSADFYLTLDSFTEGKSVRLIQWITNAELAENDGTVSNKYEFIRVAKDGSLCLGSKDLGVDVADQTWFNITADVKYVSENNYSISLYLNKTPVYTFTQTVTVPPDGGSYIVF